MILVEGTRDGGRKILISGGGRCNILPSESAPRRYVTGSSANTLRKMLRSWPLDEQRAFFERELGMRLELEPETGKLFPASNRARDVRDGLVQGVKDAGVRTWFGTKVRDVEPLPALTDPGGRWRVLLGDAPAVDAAAVVIATGGLSVPATGSDGFGLELARRLGIEVHPPYPALTPLTAHPHPHAELAGVSLRVSVAAPGVKPAFSTRGGFLFTHRGWSGPAVLDASHLAIRGQAGGGRQELHVSWGGHDWTWWSGRLAPSAESVRSALAPWLPRRLVEVLLAEAGLSPGTRLAHLRRGDRDALLRTLTAYRLPWSGDEGYRKAEVTGGGVALGAVLPATMESRSHPGLFFCGEVLDAFGPIGGHNFLWAWATGRAAGIGAAARASVGALSGPASEP